MTLPSLARLSVALVLACAIAACLQPLDRGASRGSSQNGSAATSDDATPPIELETPPIDLGDGATTADPCVRTRQRALEIRARYCAGCHAPPSKMGGFDAVLDDARLLGTVSSVALDDAGKPRPLVVPGDPQGSLLYQRVERRQMPPVVAPPLPPNPSPTVSDESELYEWIARCLGAPPVRPGSGGDAPSDAGAD